MEIIILSKNYFMNAKYNEEVICGWANQNQVNEDAIRLTNILKRKSTVQALPQLNYVHSKVETDHRKQLTNLKGATKNVLHRKSHNVLKIKRERTQGYDEREEPSPNFKNEMIYKAIRLEEPRITLSPYLTDCQLGTRLQRQSNLTEFQARANSNPFNLKNRQSEPSTFSHTLQNKMAPTKSHEFIPLVVDRSESPKKSDSRYYLKLSTLQMVNDLRKQFRSDFLLKFGAKPCMSEQRQPKEERNSSNMGRRRVDINEKIKERFRQTFIKQDIFNKNQRKEKCQGRGEAHDGIILSENAIVDRQSLQAKIQSLRSPQKGRLIFK